jgi:transcriptional regulator with XRE-family HTH domain
MHALGMNQEQLAAALDVTQPAVSKYLKERIPPPLVLYKLARLSETTMEWILTGEKPDRVMRVAEAPATYQTRLTLIEKISRLPASVQKSIENLVDVLFANLERS